MPTPCGATGLRQGVAPGLSDRVAPLQVVAWWEVPEGTGDSGQRCCAVSAGRRLVSLPISADSLFPKRSNKHPAQSRQGLPAVLQRLPDAFQGGLTLDLVLDVGWNRILPRLQLPQHLPDGRIPGPELQDR